MENKIVNINGYIKANQSYKEEIRHVQNKLQEFEPLVMEMAINVACKKTWLDWDRNIKHGSSFEFNPDDLFKTGDVYVTLLMNIWNDINVAIEKMKEEEDK